MKYYLRFGEGGLNYVESELSTDDFTKKIRAGESIHPLYNAKGKQRRYPNGLSQNGDIYVGHPLIPYDGKGAKYRNEQRGFMVIPFQYNKQELLEITKTIDETIDLEDFEKMKSWMNEHGNKVLNKLNCTVFRDHMFGHCIIDTNLDIIMFLSKYCILLQGKNISSIFGSEIYSFKDDHPYKVFYIPCVPEDLIYAEYS